MAMLAKTGFSLKANRKTLDDNDREDIVISEFYDSIDDLKYQDKVQLRILENRMLKLNFFSRDWNSKLEMDGFDSLQNENLNHTDGNYLEGSGHWTIVFDGDKFPLPPGFYVLTIYEYGKKYYTCFEVVSPVLDYKNLWVSMLDDIMANMPFEAVDNAYIRSSGQDITYNETSPNLLWKMLVLNQEYNNVMSALRDIKNNPHNKLIKEYLLVNNLKQAVVDNKATRLNQSKFHPGNKKFAIEKTISFKLSENMYLKKILGNLQSLIATCLKAAQIDLDKMTFDLEHYKNIGSANNAYARKQKAYAFIDNYCKNVVSMQSALQEVLDVDWLKELQAFEAGIVSVQSFSDPRYNVIFTLYNKLNKIQQGFAEDKKFTMLWRRSSLLYEYWNIISVAKILSKLGLKLEQTPIAFQDLDDVKVTSLQSEDMLIFRSDDEKLTVTMRYEPWIPSIENYQYRYPDTTVDEAEEWARSVTDKYDSPLYTYSRKNTPDCVLNFYYQETLDNDALYLGALIMDFKYKKRRSVWFDYDTYKNYKSEANLQFNSYKNQMCTIFMGDCTGDDEDISNIYFQPVHEVWAVYPDTENEGNVEFKPAANIRIISNTPGVEEPLKKQLKLFIERLVPGVLN